MRGLITTRTAPVLFVLLWTTGFTGIRYGIPYAPPFTFIAIRMAFASVLLALSIGAILILYFLHARSSASSVSSLHFLVPAVGTLVTIAGVALVLRQGRGREVTNP